MFQCILTTLFYSERVMICHPYLWERMLDHTAGLRMEWNFRKEGIGSLTLNLPMRWSGNSLKGFRQKNLDIHRNGIFCEPDFIMVMAKDPNTLFTQLRISYTSAIPQMQMAVDCADDSNPLFIQTGNPYLKTCITCQRRQACVTIGTLKAI